MKTLNSKISHLPSEQLEWLLSVKNLFKTTFYYNTINAKELISAIENKAIEKDYLDIGLLNTNDLEEFFKN
ncbi:MAG: hypothetical protein GQ552_08990 [Flavobacteriaceae bacterium]|nr:hypothetical protein [Flavobacteriaceae bacterium]